MNMGNPVEEVIAADIGVAEALWMMEIEVSEIYFENSLYKNQR